MNKNTINIILVVLLISSLFLVGYMSSISAYSGAHPDEPDHVKSAQYFVNHTLPPRIGDPKTVYARSVFGITYLDELDMVYWFAGKFSSLPLINAFQLPHQTRIFQVCLFALLIALTIIAGIPNHLLIFFLTPQLWYIFSYFNGDAFPLFLSAIIAHCFIKIFVSKNIQRIPRSLLMTLGICGGLLLISKRNFYAFALFLALLTPVLVLQKQKKYRKELACFLLIPLAIAFSIFAGRLGIDVMQNGWDRASLFEETREKYAHYPFRPSTPIEDAYFGMRLHERGITLSELLIDRGLVKGSIASFIGFYGLLNQPSSPIIYWLFGLLGIALFLWILISYGKDIQEKLVPLSFPLVALLGIGTTLGLSIWRSWFFDFQAQGRYLFPIIPIISVLIALSPRCRNSRVISSIIVLAMIVGCWSFWKYGILPIPKI